MKIQQINSGKVVRYQLTNDNDMMVEVLNLGGIITKVMVPDSQGIFENVVLAYEDINSYFTNPSFFGTMVGRTAGRIGNAKVKLNGSELKLHTNNNENCLHGGFDSFNTKIWSVKTIEESNEVGLKLSYLSEEGENGYPGNLNIDVYYMLNNKNELTIKYRGISDKDTLVNMTNHSYFNLSGNCKRNILEHDLFINANNMCELDEYLIPSGKLLEVKNTPFDFTTSKAIGRDIKESSTQIEYGSGYDHPWILNNEKETEITLYDKESGRAMDIITDQKAVVCYSMNFPDELMMDCGKIGQKHDAICLEVQGLPIGYDDCFIEGAIVRAGEAYINTSTYKFYTK